MRVLFTLPAASTHLFMAAPLAWAFRAAGHEVRIAAQPGLTRAVLGAGLPAVEVGGAGDPAGSPGARQTAASGMIRPDGGWGDEASSPEERRALRDRVFAPWVSAARAMAPDLLRFAERWRPDLVVTDPFVFAAPLVSTRLDVPLVRCVWGPDVLHRVSHPMRGTTEDTGERWPEGLAELFGEHGAEVRDDHPARTVDPWPTSLQLPGTPGRVPMRFVPYNGTAAAPDWVLDRPGRPRVCVTWGRTAAGTAEGEALPRVVAALADLDVEAVLAVAPSERERLGTLPGNARVAENLPLHLLMPTCDAIVNQAGSSTLLTAACHGVPQVLVPKTADSPFHASAFGAAGVAVPLDAREVTAEAVGAAVTRALTDEAVRAAVRKLHDEIAGTPSPAEVASALERLV
ncbi:nucleotide disphospho-sugar-binding domain-containing protein [Actinomadura kijaniata]|uniref:Glycosyltransferase n=1 Tax=Actinomadura kijaniata TaxID=46161 RepID=B3TMP5_ACTKI|nr:nucleotide disphospho-sugar-binding domain-containing protein [Actinomadura kijaniata]ACB46475.1 glycosyltransferase [Actinomadura kijaniata]